MSDRGPSYGDRLGALELRLAASLDVGSVLDVRRQIVALIGESLRAGDDRDRDHVELRRRARELRRQSEVVAGELLISMQTRGLRRSGGGDQRTGSQAATPKLADYGFRWRTQTSRWQARARALAMPSFNRRLAEATTIADIKALIAEAATLSRRARKQKDRGAQGVAIARRMAAKRAGGALPELGTGGTLVRWKMLARLTEQEFMRAVEDASKAAMAYKPEAVPQIVMTRSGWVKDERGNACRRVYAAAADDPAPAR
jgi:hypothetical protein